MQNILSRRLLLGMAVLLAAMALEFGWLHLLQPLENRLLDTFVRWQARVPDADPDIVIVNIDERSLANFSDSLGRWPWPRSVHAELVEGLEKQHPRAIVFDVLFSDPDLARKEADDYFAQTIRATDNTYFPMLRLEDGDPAAGLSLAQFGPQLGITPGPAAKPDARVAMVLPLPAMLETGRLGIHNALADDDKVVRRFYLSMDAQGWRIPALPARVAQGLGYALPAEDVIALHWRGPALAFRYVSYWDVYQDMQRKQPLRPTDEFRGKIVIIGATATGLHDIRATPVDGFYPGVEILATAIDNLKRGNPMRQAPGVWAPSLAVLLAAMVTLLFARYRHPLFIGLGLFGGTGLLLAGSYVAVGLRWLVPVLSPLAFAWAQYAALALREYLAERRSRMQAVSTFGRFLDPRVVELLVGRGETTASLSGQSREISVLFSDIRGFTTLSEANPPEVVVDLLNRYFTQQAEVIFEQEGTLDKYIGDAIMAFWGAPAEQPDHALRAVHAALAMSERLEAFRKSAGALGQELEIGIGIHSGPAVVGFIGATSRQDYTAIGDTVNLASRIEGQTKGIARILVSEETRRLCQLDAGCPFEFVDCGSYQVKGRAQPVHLFEPRKRT
ncbi:MAG TPA: adenylate/guanylate cyclase domain-containing protein [Novimethylophilus sp.]|jgi:adenylate cyclase|uniref:CHASE2 domain-containing protein n=1 Tax=Novimethylophilus sp. TaxID=2137426 RepID=UPI002F3EE1A5